MTNDAANLNQKQDYNGKESLIVGNGEKLGILHVGDSILTVSNNKNLILKDVLHVPQIEKNLISISQLIACNNIDVLFNSVGCVVKDKATGKVLLQGRLKEGLYHFDLPNQTKPYPSRVNSTFLTKQESSQVFSSKKTKTSEPEPQVSQVASTSNVEVWHRRLGHPSLRTLSKILQTCNQNSLINEKKLFCDACQYGKSHLLPFSISDSHAEKPLDLIHSDIWGPSPIASSSGFRYYIHFVDDYSRYTWLYPLKNKSDALQTFILFKNLVENLFDKKIKSLQSDMGGEYLSFTNFVQQHGIQVRYSCPFTSAQNGRAERKHRHIVETGLTLLAQAKIPLKYWPEAFQTATFLINRLPTPTLTNISPIQQLFGKVPNYLSLKFFGCACFPCLRPYQNHKFQFHSTKCVFLGYSNSHKGYKCLSSTR